ncbi:MAG: hypothetical protein AAF411_00080 [Myxococcota bacterium]
MAYYERFLTAADAADTTRPAAEARVRATRQQLERTGVALDGVPAGAEVRIDATVTSARSAKSARAPARTNRRAGWSAKTTGTRTAPSNATRRWDA